MGGATLEARELFPEELLFDGALVLGLSADELDRGGEGGAVSLSRGRMAEGSDCMRPCREGFGCHESVTNGAPNASEA